MQRFGGARRDEEKSRAKERIFSFRNKNQAWDPRDQRPELWNIFNTRIAPGESIRVFPLSNWTELDVWHYIAAENIPVVRFISPRNVRSLSDPEPGLWSMTTGCRSSRASRPQMRRVRFRTLGCYPLTGAIESDATTLADVIREMETARVSERQGRLIDADDAGSMEKKKREGYF